MSSILIIGESGSGKSTSLRNINGDETILINALNKPLPFRGGAKKFGANAIFTDDSRIIVNEILKAEKNKNIKLIVIDDFQSIMTNAFMKTIDIKGYEKFTKIGKNVWDIVNAANGSRIDLKVVLIAHSDTDINGKVKCKTVGKLVDEKISIEGMCTVVLHSKVSNGKYVFLTQNDGANIAKSPIGMFESLEIDNDLAKVISAFDSYYNDDEVIKKGFSKVDLITEEQVKELNHLLLVNKISESKISEMLEKGEATQIGELEKEYAERCIKRLEDKISSKVKYETEDVNM